ncbi:MAG TPA: glycosyltransferase family 2 protein [Patescibacteria group bacterium]|nr:glycosyltransferase family 2 protein [Patescibacteria group bacterium]
MICAIILTHNDGNGIEKTLSKLMWCDELIVVDDDSTDDTIEKVKPFTSRVFKHNVNGDFASQRNFGLSKTNSDWVLFIDSDETVSTDLEHEIQGAIERKEFAGYFLKRDDFMYGQKLTHGETGSVRLLRLGKKDAGIWRRSVHEVWDIKGPVGSINSPLQHFPHPNVAQFLDEINYYSTLNAKFMYDQGIHVNRLQIVCYPVAKFFVNYILRAGFLDGTPGAIMALMMSFHSFLTRAKLYQLWHMASKPEEQAAV